jgi:hypothetical protein
VTVLLLLASGAALTAFRRQPEPAAPEVGTSLVLTTAPSGAKVSIDGWVRGTTPLRISSVPGRRLAVRLDLDHYGSISETVLVGQKSPQGHHWEMPHPATVEVAPTELVPVESPKEPALGTLHLVVLPGAKSECHEEGNGSAPLKLKDSAIQSIELPEGYYLCTFTHPDFPNSFPQRKRLHVDADSTLTVKIGFH